jgi:hypothetical protein
MFGKNLALITALALASVPATAGACVLDNTQPAAAPTSTDSYGNRNLGGPYGFYSYPSHRHVDGGLDRALPATGGGVASHDYDRNYGSAWYGRDYGAPYYGGAYYDGGVLYRERRDR